MTQRDSWAGPGLAAEHYADVAETHSAVVFFAGDRAYKLKKPVSTSFLDFSTPEARAASCQRETELNRRFTHDVYLGTAEIRDPAGQVCDHLVVMRRMPAARRLSALVRTGEPVAAAVRQVARILAVQHASAPRSPRISEQGSRDALQRRWQDNLGQIRPLSRTLLAAQAIDEVERLAGRFLAGRADLFDARIRTGHILDGHGDLLADDIFCLDDGPRILDCLEFDDRLRWLDGLDDAACLAMDLERLGAGELAGRFTGWYIEYSGDPAPLAFRKELAGIPPGQHAASPYGTGIYSPAWIQRTYAELLRRAGELLSQGESVIADATWTSAGQRAAAAATAGSAAADLVQLHCTTPAALAGRRMTSRKGSASDADPDVAMRMAGDQAPWPEAIPLDSRPCESPGASADLVQQALGAIRPHGPEHAVTIDPPPERWRVGCARAKR